MTFKEFQNWTQLMDERTGWDRLTRVQLLSHLFEETGELARSINRVYEYRDEIQKDHIDNIKMEIVDVLWFLFKIAERFSIDVENEVISFTKRADSWTPNKHSFKLKNALESLEEEL